MSLCYFIAAILFILFIARWNRSVKLLIFLLIAFISGFIGGSIIVSCSNTHKKDNTCNVIKAAQPTHSVIFTTLTALLSNNSVDIKTTSQSGNESFREVASVTYNISICHRRPLHLRGDPKWYNTS